MILDYLLSGGDTGGAVRASLENPTVPLSDPAAWNEHFGSYAASGTGEIVTHKRAISLAAVWASVQMISGDVSKLPLSTFRKQPPAKPQPDESHYLFPKINPLGQANPEISALKLWRRAMVHALLWQNAFILPDWQGPRIAGFYNFLPDRTDLFRHKGRLWVITEVGDEGQVKAFPYSEVIHIEGLTLDGLAGEDLVVAAREDFGQALAARGFTSKFFKHNLTAGGILQVPPGATPKATKKMEQAIEERGGSDKAFKTLIMRDNFKWHSTQVAPEAAQMVELDEAKVRDVARRFLLSPTRLGVKESISYNSLEADRRSYHDTTLSYWLSIIRSELNSKCLTTQGRARWLIDYNVNLALLWADAQTLASIAVQGINATDAGGQALFTVNEARSWFNLPPHPDAPDDPDPPADPDDDENARAAFELLISREMVRIVRRLNVHTLKAARACASSRSGVPWAEWLTRLRDDHLEVARDYLATPLRAVGAAGYLVPDERAAPDLLHEYKLLLEDLASRFSAVDLPEAVEPALETFEQTTAANLAAQLIRSADDAD
jgi:HK97 family phage portal protein